MDTSTCGKAPRIRCTAAALAALLLPAAARANIRVERKPVEVETRTYDPKDPPKNVHGLGVHESGLTISEFAFKPGMKLAPGVPRPQRDGKCQEAVVVQSVTITLELKITIWLPDDATDKLKAHEEGHRQMTEKVYLERAEKAAQAAARLLDGRRINAEAENCDGINKAIDEAIAEAVKKAYGPYLTETADVSARAGEIYDDLTTHGTNTLDEKTAAAQAFAKQAEEARVKGATTKPGGRPPATQPRPALPPPPHRASP